MTLLSLKVVVVADFLQIVLDSLLVPDPLTVVYVVLYFMMVLFGESKDVVFDPRDLHSR